MVAVRDVIENVARRLRGGDPAQSIEGRVVTGTVTAIESEFAVIDVGLKSEGRVPLREFAAPGRKAEIEVGDSVEVYVDRIENDQGEAMLSRDRARREAAWDRLETEFTAGNRVEGIIFGRVKGGFTVDLGGTIAFLPGSQVDSRPGSDVTPLMDIPQAFQILKMDRRRGNIVVSRRAVLEETGAEQRSGLVMSLAEGQVVDGVVKNITDYGAFVDLGGIDGLLHVTDISYKRVNHPSEAFAAGDTVKVKILRLNRETQRISLGMKQLEADPWKGVGARYPVGRVFKGRVTSITEYGAFVELEPGIEGLVHVSEMSWTKKNVHPGKIVSKSQEVDVAVLDVEEENGRMSLGLKQAQPNPWEAFAASHPVGTEVEGEVKNATEFGLFVGLDGDVDGMVHMSDIAWGVTGEEALNLHRKGEMVKAVVLDVDVEKERISLGMKQLAPRDFKPSQIPDTFMLASAQTLVDSIHEPDKVRSVLADMVSWERQGPSAWLGALRALYREPNRMTADGLAKTIHEVLIQMERHELVPMLFLAQAAAYDRLGDGVARDLFALEAADGFIELDDPVGAEAALNLARC